MKNKHNLLRTILLIVVAFSLWLSCIEPATTQITILHTNDMHGAFVPSKATWIKENPKPLIGGFLALAHYLKEARSQTSNTLLLDAGDLMTGNEICNIEHKGAKGGALIDMMNLMGYEGMTIGNHEFDISQENVVKLIEISEFPIYSANLYREDGQLFAPAAYHIYNKHGLRIGVIGIITESLYGVLHHDKRRGLVVKSNAETIEKIVDEIDSGTDLIVVLSHCGAEADSVLAENLDRRVDVIVGGHSHTRIYQPRKVNHILIAQAGDKCRYLGELDLTVVADTVQEFSGNLIPLWVKDITKDSVIEKKVNHFQKLIDEKYGKVIGHSKTDLNSSRHAESTIGNFVADCVREYAGTDFAGINSGSIRKSLPAGEIKMIDIREVLPLGNKICTFKVSGEQLLKFMHHNAKAAALREHGIIQVSGLTIHWKKLPDGTIRIVKALVNGQPVDPQKVYTGATDDFVLFANSQQYLGIDPTEKQDRGILVANVVMDIIERKGEISSKIEGRLREE